MSEALLPIFKLASRGIKTNHGAGSYGGNIKSKLFEFISDWRMIVWFIFVLGLFRAPASASLAQTKIRNDVDVGFVRASPKTPLNEQQKPSRNKNLFFDISWRRVNSSHSRSSGDRSSRQRKGMRAACRWKNMLNHLGAFCCWRQVCDVTTIMPVGVVMRSRKST